MSSQRLGRSETIGRQRCELSATHPDRSQPPGGSPAAHASFGVEAGRAVPVMGKREADGDG